MTGREGDIANDYTARARILNNSNPGEEEPLECQQTAKINETKETNIAEILIEKIVTEEKRIRDCIEKVKARLR